MREVGRDNIEGLEEEGGKPVAEKLDEDGADELNGLRWVAGHNRCPA